MTRDSPASGIQRLEIEVRGADQSVNRKTLACHTAVAPIQNESRKPVGYRVEHPPLTPETHFRRPFTT